MSLPLDDEIRRAMLEEARDRLRGLRGASKSEALLGVHGLKVNARALGLSELLTVLNALEGRVSAGHPEALSQTLQAIQALLDHPSEETRHRVEVLETFLAEAADHLESMERHLEILSTSPKDKSAQKELYRVLHTFKGAAAFAGLEDGSHAAHLLEEMLAQVQEGRRPLDPPLTELFGAGVRLLRAIVDEPDRGEDHKKALVALSGAHGMLARSPAVRESSIPPQPKKRRSERRREAPFVLHLPLEETQKIEDSAVSSIGLSQEIKTMAAKVQDAASDLREAQTQVFALQDGSGQLAVEIGSTASALDFIAADLDTKAAHVGSQGRRCQKVVRNNRDTEASWLFDRLAAVAEEAAAGRQLPVVVESVGDRIVVDREVAGRLLDPLLHLVRNAVAHGCEEQPQRVALGKEPVGTIVLKAVDRGPRVEYSVEDDGPGIDTERIRQRLHSMGLFPPEQVDGASRDQILDWMFLPGVSTRGRADQLSGRGVGLDAVRADVARLSGKVHVAWTKKGEGTQFVLSVPKRFGELRSLVLRVGRHRFAIPLSKVNRVEALPKKEVAGSRILLEEGDVPLLFLASRLGLHRHKSTVCQAVILSGEQGVWALAVEAVEGVSSLQRPSLKKVLRDVGPYLGMAIDPLGLPVLVLDEAALAADDKAARVSAESLRVLVADDSRTARSMVSAALENGGYEVTLAANGLEAWHKLSVDRFDLLITDLEMPLLDGFALLERLQTEPHLARLPTMVLTSRLGEGVRKKSGSLGARALLAKPITGSRLLREVDEVLDC